MARIRTIKPEFWIDERVGECSPTARLLFIATWNFADDNGNLERSAKQLKAQAMPYDAVDCEALLLELLAAGLLEEYESNGRKYLHISGFDKHQKIEKKSAARHPLPDSSPTAPLVVPEQSALEGKVREWKGGEGGPAPLVEPTPDGLHPMQYATRLMEELEMPDTRGNKHAVTSAIEVVIRSGKSPPSAYEFLLAQAKDAQDRGEVIDKFWFEDSKWKPAPARMPRRKGRNLDELYGADEKAAAQ